MPDLHSRWRVRASHGALDLDVRLPWDFIDAPYSRSILRRAYDVILRRLSSGITLDDAERKHESKMG